MNIVLYDELQMVNECMSILLPHNNPQELEILWFSNYFENIIFCNFLYTQYGQVPKEVQNLRRFPETK